MADSSPIPMPNQSYFVAAGKKNRRSQLDESGDFTHKLPHEYDQEGLDSTPQALEQDEGGEDNVETPDKKFG